MFLRDDEVGKHVAPHLERGWRILDYGSGTGLISRWLAQKVGVEPTLCDLVEYSNRRREFPFVSMTDPFHIPEPDAAFDAVILLFALHHNEYPDQTKVLTEAARLAARRLIVIEDTPFNAVDRVFNVGWDKVLNMRHGVPTPFSFRGVDEWHSVFEEHDLTVRHTESYRPLWPTLGTYHHTLFVLQPARPSPE